MAGAKGDIILLKKQLTKEDNSPERTLDILEQVGKISITLELLKKTKIGKSVGRLRNSKNEKIAAAALAIVSKWKKIASTLSKPQEAKESKPSTTNSEDEKNNGLEKKASPAAATVSSTTSGTINSNDADNDKNSAAPKNIEAAAGTYSFEEKGEKMRINACKALLRNLIRGADSSKFGEFPSKDTVATVVDAIEISLYEKFQNPSAYQSQLRSRLSNLRTNEKLRYLVATCEISPFVFVSMTAQEMATDKAKAKIEEAMATAKEAARSDWAQANHDKLQEQAGVSKDSVSMYRCPECRCEKVRSFAMQTRSADEPMTVFCTCLNPKCGKKFRR